MIRILVVDDAAFVRLAIKTLLTNNGFEVVGEAADGMRGIEKYFELKPDVVLLDITMPKMNGLEALKEIRKQDPAAKIIMLSAMGQEQFVREAVLSGAASFIVKPYKDEYVIKTLHKLFDKSNVPSYGR